jgi:hypothetical protein
MTTDLVTVEEARFLPALTLPQAMARRDAMVKFVQDIMVKDVDYGIIPGTDKPTLYKPGAERLCSFFGLTPDFEVVKEIEDWAGAEPLFYYRYKCRLLRDGRAVGDGEGSCNSRESKYRWRQQDRVCPNCEKPAIKKSKYAPRNDLSAAPGWYCYAKAGGCGTEFAANDPAITGQQTGRAPNPDIFDLVNTIQKMGQKRAFIAATLIAVNASEFFTQDLDDLQVSTTVPSADPALLDILRAELAAARDRLRSVGGETRPLGKKQVEAMDARALADELGQTLDTAWTLAKSRLTERQAPSGYGPTTAEQSELYDEMGAATAEASTQ